MTRPQLPPGPYMPTLVIAPDIAEIYGCTRSNVDTWRANEWLGEPAAIVSGHDAWTYETLAPRLSEFLSPPRWDLRGRPPVHRSPDPDALKRVRERSEVPSGVSPAGLAEIAYCMWKPAKWMQSPARRPLMPPPIARLGPPLKRDGSAARQDAAWDLAAFVRWPEFDRRGRGAELIASFRIT